MKTVSYEDTRVYVCIRMSNGLWFCYNILSYRIQDVNWQNVAKIAKGREYGYIEKDLERSLKKKKIDFAKYVKTMGR